MHDFGTTISSAPPPMPLYGRGGLDMGYKKEDFKMRLGLFGSEGSTVEIVQRHRGCLGYLRHR